MSSDILTTYSCATCKCPHHTMCIYLLTTCAQWFYIWHIVFSDVCPVPWWLISWLSHHDSGKLNPWLNRIPAHWPKSQATLLLTCKPSIHTRHYCCSLWPTSMICNNHSLITITLPQTDVPNPRPSNLLAIVVDVLPNGAPSKIILGAGYLSGHRLTSYFLGQYLPFLSTHIP